MGKALGRILIEFFEHFGLFFGLFGRLIAYFSRAIAGYISELFALLLQSLEPVTVIVSIIFAMISLRKASDINRSELIKRVVVSVMKGLAVVPIVYLLIMLMWSTEETVQFVSGHRSSLVIALVFGAAMIVYSLFLERKFKTEQESPESNVGGG
jgi:hypothetical protein